MKTVFEFKRPSGIVLKEVFCDGGFQFYLFMGGEERKICLYKVENEDIEERNLFLGYTAEEVLASGRDILGEKLCANGDPEYSEVKKVMPKITDKAYAFLGGPASWAGVTVEPSGEIIHQASGRDREPKPIFDPKSVDLELGAIVPKRMLLGQEYPVMISLHNDGINSLEFLYFVESGDTDRDPIVWIRIKRYKNDNPAEYTLEYKVAAISREGDEHLLNDNPPTEEVFLDALCDTVCYWVKYYDHGAQITIPEKEIERVGRGAVAFSALTFTGDHPHYGHKFYGMDLHDNFPPNYIWAIEAACVLGRVAWAKGIVRHMLDYALNDEGRICYRQGTGLNFGVSATEYGMLLYIINKYKKILGLNALSETEALKFAGMGNEILAHCINCPEFDGLTLVKMCAEADTNERVNVYLNNNLWAIRGFEALCGLLGKTSVRASVYTDMAKLLTENVGKMMEKYAVKNTRFGSLVPFRFGYTATPLTLSICNDTFRPLTGEENAIYFTTARTRGPESSEQDITENTYANYRYYPEALCSMLIPEEIADNIVRMRETLGGELLGMTRFRSWVDNWPVVHYARFLIETDRIEKYLLLLYAHTAHHGRPDLMAYYEQIYLNGSPKANDCVPSLLTTPIMLGWMFAYERVTDGHLQLLSAVPKKWFSDKFSAKNIGYSGGIINIDYDGEKLSVSSSSEIPENTEIIWRNKENIDLSDIKIGSEYVKDIIKNKIIIKSGINKFEIMLK